MGRSKITQKPIRTLSISQTEEIAALKRAVQNGYPQLEALKLALRDEKQLAKAERKKKRARAKNKAARTARRKAR